MPTGKTNVKSAYKNRKPLDSKYIEEPLYYKSSGIVSGQANEDDLLVMGFSENIRLNTLKKFFCKNPTGFS